jgi:hypothetical protein
MAMRLTGIGSQYAGSAAREARGGVRRPGCEAEAFSGMSRVPTPLNGACAGSGLYDEPNPRPLPTTR